MDLPSVLKFPQQRAGNPLVLLTQAGNVGTHFLYHIRFIMLAEVQVIYKIIRFYMKGIIYCHNFFEHPDMFFNLLHYRVGTGAKLYWCI
jgi:hypothetical protein